MMGLLSTWDYRTMISAMDESFGYYKLSSEQWKNLSKGLVAFPYEQIDSDKVFGIASQLSTVLKDLDIARLTSNIERMYDQLSNWKTSEDEIDYDDISVNDDGSLCYQDQCVTQPEINDIWNTFVQNCENLGSKAIEAIKDKAWVIQWIFKFIFDLKDCYLTVAGIIFVIIGLGHNKEISIKEYILFCYHKFRLV